MYRFCDIFAASFEVFRTVSSTKIDSSTRSASARASDGRDDADDLAPVLQPNDPLERILAAQLGDHDLVYLRFQTGKHRS